MEDFGSSEYKTKKAAVFLRNAPKPFSTDVYSDTYLLLPKNLAAYNLYSTNDFFAGLLVFLPSVVASLMVEKDAERDWPAVVSRIMVLAQIAWLVIFITSWPLGWVHHLAKSRAQLLNYINLIRLGTNVGLTVPEAVLNRQVFAVNLLLALKLQRYEKLALILWAVAIAASVAIMQWEGRTAGGVLGQKLAVRDANVVMFAFWQGLKLLIQISVVLQKAAVFSLDAGAAAGDVTDANLGYYVKFFCSQSVAGGHMESPRPNPQADRQCYPVDNSNETTGSKVDLGVFGAKDFASSGSTLGYSAKFDISASHKLTPESKDITVSMVPFPFGPSPRDLNCSSVPGTTLSPHSTKAATQDNPKRFKIRGLQEAIPEAASPPGTEVFMSSYDTRFSLHGSSIPPHSPNFSARAFTAKNSLRKFARRSAEQPFTLNKRFPAHTPVQHESFPPVSLEAAKNEILDDVNRKVEQEKNKFFSVCWRLWTRCLNFNIHDGYTGVVYRNIYLPWKSITKMTIAVFVNIPLNVIWVVLCLILFVPRVLFKIFVVTPVVVIKDYRKSNSASTYQEYRETHKVPLFTESASTIIANKLLHRISGNQSKEYAGSIHALGSY